MLNVNTQLEQRLENHKWQLATIKALASIKRPQKEFKPYVLPLSLNNSPLNQLVKRKIQPTPDIIDDSRSQAQYCLSLIDDPLWKRICRELESMMGSFAVLKLWKCELGTLSSCAKTLDLYCQTEEVAQFAHQYAFVILGALQPYFPVLKELEVKVTSATEKKHKTSNNFCK